MAFDATNPVQRGIGGDATQPKLRSKKIQSKGGVEERKEGGGKEIGRSPTFHFGTERLKLVFATRTPTENLEHLPLFRVIGSQNFPHPPQQQPNGRRQKDETNRAARARSTKTEMCFCFGFGSF